MLDANEAADRARHVEFHRGQRRQDSEWAQKYADLLERLDRMFEDKQKK